MLNETEILTLLQEIKQCSCKTIDVQSTIIDYLPNVVSGVFALFTSIVAWKLIIGLCMFGYKEAKKCYFKQFDEADKAIICQMPPRKDESDDESVIEVPHQV